jgi:hypothetical protein
MDNNEFSILDWERAVAMGTNCRRAAARMSPFQMISGMAGEVA